MILTSVRREHHFGLTLTFISVYNSHLISIYWALHSLPEGKVTSSNCEASVVDTEPPAEQSPAPWMLWACTWCEGDCEASAWLKTNRTELGWNFSHGEGLKCRHSVKNCTLEVPFSVDSFIAERDKVFLTHNKARRTKAYKHIFTGIYH